MLWAFSSLLNTRLQGVFIEIFSHLNQLSTGEALAQAGGKVVCPLVSFLLCLWTLALAAHWIQGGWVWRRRRQGKQKGSFRFFFTLLKVGVIGGIGYLFMRREQSMSASWVQTTFFLLVQVTTGLVVLGLGDLIYQKWKYHHNMRMTRQEVKEERREAEGDTQTKNKMRRKL